MDETLPGLLAAEGARLVALADLRKPRRDLTMKTFRRFCSVAALFVLVNGAARQAVEASDTATPAKVQSRSLYVAPNGKRDADGLTPETALTPQRAEEISQPGDVIYFTAGQYEYKQGDHAITIRHSGKPGSPITYTPAPGAEVVLRSSGAWEVIKILGARHIEVRGFRVIGNARNVTMEEATREMSNLKNPRTCGNGIGISDDPVTKASSAYITVRDCEVSDCSGSGIFSTHVDYLTFEGNVVYRCAFWSPYGNSGLSVYQPTAVDESTDYKIFIRNNVCFENYENIPFFHSNENDPTKRKVTDGNGIIIDDYLNTQSWGGGVGKPYPGRTLVANNVVFANGGSGIHAFKSCNVDIVHNYASDNNRHPQLKDGQIFANASKNVRILNNVIVGPTGKPATTNSKNESLLLDHNLLASLDGGVPGFQGEKANNIVAPPGLILRGWNEGKRGFTASPDSPLRGAATPLSEAGRDFFGRVRDAARPDVGPFVLSRN